MEFRPGTEQRVCSQGDVVVIPGGTKHEAWFREDTEVRFLRASARGLSARWQTRAAATRAASRGSNPSRVLRPVLSAQRKVILAPGS